ncbi:DNA polymerase III subunit gamma/tau [Pedobacter heparinus]|uniref:DNA polymerase III subunit gamma/tau n=1 Tax=Pedobacter heparinus (strain ATCC 13125 / DSM 2366 / CIP 104194 / JCM 7457 / NBRC 12017 / NCIMB 9290 / NRRL B-14731 / HIM 762-3) TaxID=485917 RepID=C6Y1I2_PEDHD|nr:DNA polymerase III subunit gamma/tau [Pedobacter heparinus]ACU02958.1 DNA polymerase III, subunits gamma and tau [Pedobacter heparinus DSM 2366]
MENFIVSARKYRPATFETVVGQQHITGTLKNAIKNNQLAQAFLFCGPRGVGKTTCARILAKTINCTSLTAEQEACGTCESCVSFQTGHSFNFHELDAASNNSVDDIRSLIEQVRIPPQAGKYKIYIIDEVHMLSANAFNAFLKTLEEPPSYAIFILATTEKHKILPTILSRCQIFDFNRIQVEDISGHLNKIAQRENIAVEADGLHIIAQKADGGLRDALSMFDQIVSYTNKNLTYKSVIDNLNILDYDYYFKLTQHLTATDVSHTLILFDEILNNGFDGNNFINGLASHLRNLLVAKDPQTTKLLEVSENIKQKYISQSQQTPVSFILTALNLANQCDLNYKNSKNQRLQVEMALIKMCHIPSVLQLASQPLTNTATDPDQIKKKTSISTEQSSFTAPATSVAESPVPVNLPPVIPAEVNPTVNIPKKTPPPSSKIVLNPISLAQQSKVAMLVPSLNGIQNNAEGADGDEPKYITGSDKEIFTQDQLLLYWNQYTSMVKEANRINVYTLMSTSVPILEKPDEILVQVEHKLQEDLLQEEMIDLLNFLRPRLKNFSIYIKTKQVVKEVVNRLYTSTEKYQYLVEKNPKLEEMRRRFNLDVNP